VATWLTRLRVAAIRCGYKQKSDASSLRTPNNMATHRTLPICVNASTYLCTSSTPLVKKNSDTPLVHDGESCPVLKIKCAYIKLEKIL
jgi:hypothetical protein